MTPATTVLVVMGVSGVGKTTLGEALAARLGWTFKDGDDLHPASNVAKMHAGHPLTDADRWPWLDAIGAWMDGLAARSQSGVVAASVLKRAYRDRLRQGRPQVRFVFIELAQPLVAERLAHRTGHFWPPSLLPTQFAALEPPAADEPAITVDGSLPPDGQVEAVIHALGEVRA